MKYVKETLGFNLDIAKTGIRHLHHKSKAYDIGIYFESNGHGNIAFKDDIITKITKLNSFCNSAVDSQVLEFINIFLSMFNRTIGDSLSALICIESCLRFLNMSIDDFYNIYNEYPAVNVKVKISNKSIFKPNDDETRLVSPIDMQEKIDEIVSKYECGRSFIRPSGTEDVLRIYAEARTLEEANEIAELVKTYILTNYQ